jgi:DNA-binding IclR family transcriptional regulator
LAILEALAQEGREVTLKQVSIIVGLDASTTHRLLQTMAARGFVRQEEDSGKYYLGLRAFEVGNAVPHTSHLRGLARPILAALTEKTEETSNLAVRDAWNGVYLEQQTSPHYLRMAAEVGRVIPLHCTAVGKVLLAGIPDEELVRFLHRERFSPLTTRTIVSPEELEQEIHWIRTSGYAVDDEEFEEGAKCVAAPVRDRSDRVVATVSVSGPAARFTTDRLNLFIPLVKKAGMDVSRALGYQSAPTPGF